MMNEQPQDGNEGPGRRRNSLSRLRSSMAPETLARVDRMARIKQGYVTGPHDKLLEQAVADMMEGQAAFDVSSGYATSEALKERALFVIGDSGSGKSTAIKRIFARTSGLESFVDEYGQKIAPTFSFKAPKPLTMKLLAKTGLRAIGYPIERDRQENEMWDLFREQLKQREVLWLNIDEMQHAVKGSGHTAVQDIADIVKNLLQLDDWPLNAILSGVTSLAAFLQFEDSQLRNRCRIVRFEPMTRGADTKRLKRAVEGVITVHAEMQAADAVLTDEFLHRLMHATGGAFGTSIQITREAIFIALRAGREQVLPEDFILFYGRASGCRPDENVFTAPNWHMIDPGKAIQDYVIRHQEEEAAARKARGRK